MVVIWGDQNGQGFPIRSRVGCEILDADIDGGGIGGEADEDNIGGLILIVMLHNISCDLVGTIFCIACITYILLLRIQGIRTHVAKTILYYTVAC